MRAYATQVEVLRRLRSAGQQFVRVEHVRVNDGGQAVIGDVQNEEAKAQRKLLVPNSTARSLPTPICETDLFLARSDETATPFAKTCTSAEQTTARRQRIP
jgi:hypothetical protein